MHILYNEGLINNFFKNTPVSESSPPIIPDFDREFSFYVPVAVHAHFIVGNVAYVFFVCFSAAVSEALGKRFSPSFSG